MGVGIYDHLLRNDDTKRKLIAVNNRQQIMDREGKKKQRLLKEDLYDNLRSLMERGHLKLLDDENLRLSLASIQEEYPKNEKGLTKRRIHGNYSHIAEGLIRAAIIGKEKDINMWIRSIRV